MEMTYNGTLVMPANYAVVNEEEMTYVEGGEIAYKYARLSEIISDLSYIVNCCWAGNAAALTVGALGGIFCKIFAGISGAWFTNILTKASNAHSKAENLKWQKGNVYGELTISTSFLWCTGIEVNA